MTLLTTMTLPAAAPVVTEPAHEVTPAPIADAAPATVANTVTKRPPRSRRDRAKILWQAGEIERLKAEVAELTKLRDEVVELRAELTELQEQHQLALENLDLWRRRTPQTPRRNILNVR
jgi:hypothetical protein